MSWSIFHVLGSGGVGGDAMKRMIRPGNGGTELGAYHIEMISYG